jgi:membrane protease YdiL (CAAX protease family)
VKEDDFIRESPLPSEARTGSFAETAPPSESLSEEMFPTEPQSSRSPARPLLAWLVILLGAISVIFLQARRSTDGARVTGGDLVNDLQAKYLVGVSRISRGILTQPSAREGFSGDRQIKHLRWALLLHAVGDGALAREELGRLDALSEEASEKQRELVRVVTALIGTAQEPPQAAVPLPPEELDLIRREFGWLGRLAVTSAEGEGAAVRDQMLGQAQGTMTAIVGLMAVGVLGLMIGTGLLLGWAVMVLTGRLQFRLRQPSGTGGYYAETFALWFVAFFGLSILAGWLAPPQWALTAAGVAAGLSLLTLFWPVWRGVPATQVRDELGITWPPGGWREIGWGILGYVGGLPVVFVGLLMTVLLMRGQSLLTGTALFAYAEPPVHPIIEPLAHGSLWIRLQAIAVVLLVPITEEIMFRGVLYRHLREAFGRWGWLVSLLLSLLTSSLLFAIIHPQGALGVPLLTAVAIVLALLREWRASLIAPIVTHMIVNGVTTSLVLLIFA